MLRAAADRAELAVNTTFGFSPCARRLSPKALAFFTANVPPETTTFVQFGHAPDSVRMPAVTFSVPVDELVAPRLCGSATRRTA